jgi:hypothetical protein
MKITITLTESEKAGIISYLKEVDEITDQSTPAGIDFAIEMEVRTRLYHALRDPKEAISDYVADAERKQLETKPSRRVGQYVDVDTDAMGNCYSDADPGL